MMKPRLQAKPTSSRSRSQNGRTYACTKLISRSRKPKLNRSPKRRLSQSLIPRLTRLRPKPRLMSRNPKPKTSCSPMQRHNLLNEFMNSTKSLGARMFNPFRIGTKHIRNLRNMNPTNEKEHTTRRA